MATYYVYTGPMGELLRITLCGDDQPSECVQELLNLAGAGRLVQVMYRPAGSSWERLCAVEEDLLRADAAGWIGEPGWFIVAGECLTLPGLTGWMEHADGWVLVACPSVYANEHETDFLVIEREEFEDGFKPYIRACVPIGEDSGLRLNRALREVESLETSFAEMGI